jgi:signal transduction histidine kinase
VSRLATLVGDLLDVTQLQAGKLSLRRESCLVGELVSEVVDGYTRVSKRHQLVLENRAPEARVMGDRSRLEQVFTNLVDNAIKYSPQGGEVRVELEVADGEVVVSVTDSGIGIARDQQDRIFTRFFRASSAPVANYGGLGLGLHISRQIVERHHGRITFESVLGEGSTFRVALPLAGTSATRTASKRDARS